jgi:hypothetical protein
MEIARSDKLPGVTRWAMRERMVGYFLNIIHQQGEGFEHYERRSLRTSVIQITLGVTKVRAHCMKCELVQGYFFARPGGPHRCSSPFDEHLLR